MDGKKKLMNIWTKAKQHPWPGFIPLAFVAFIALELPDGLPGIDWSSIQTGSYLLAVRVPKMQAVTASASGEQTVQQ